MLRNDSQFEKSNTGRNRREVLTFPGQREDGKTGKKLEPPYVGCYILNGLPATERRAGFRWGSLGSVNLGS
jgi:hypothetical protein